VYYNEVMRLDIISMARDLLEQRILHLRDIDGKLEGNSKLGWDTPWHHVKQGERTNCHFWNTIMFQHLFKKVPQSLKKGRAWVPIGCQSCFKIVVRPQTLRGLFALEALQERLGYESKCGIELRPHVFGLYGGYFYTRSLQEGHERYAEVRAEVDKTQDLGPDVPVILKRGCTEMEFETGPSDQWLVYPEQIEVEQLIEQKINHDLVMRGQPQHGVHFVHGRWIRFAYQWGDPTVFDYCENLYPSYVTYHDREVSDDGDRLAAGS